MEEYVFDGHLTIDELVEIAEHKKFVRIDPRIDRFITQAFTEAAVAASTGEVYGRSTGVGANRHTKATSDPLTHGRNLLRSHAVDAGAPVSHEATRAMMAVRLNQIAQGGSGINPEIARMLCRMLNVDAMPELRELGSVGTADLPALAGTALAMLGERTVSAPLEPLAEIGADSALPFMSSSALTIARAALLIHHLDALLRAQSSVFLLSAAGARAQPDAFSLAAARAIPSDTVSALARTIATIRAQSTWQARRIQDPYAFRAFLGAYDVLNGAGERLRECVEKLMNIAQENPLFSAGTPQVLHHGAFHQAHLAHELDATALALAQSASLAVSRIRFLNDDAITGLPRFLAPNAGGSSGTMIVEYVAASAMGDILAASSPVSMYSTVLSCGLEDDATFATTSVRKLEQAVSGYETLLAAELLVAVRAIRLVPPHDLVLDGPLLNVWASADAALPKSMADRDLRGDLESARELVITLGGGSAATDC